MTDLKMKGGKMEKVQTASLRTQEHWLQGGWRTSDNNKMTTLVASLPANKESMVFKISCTELVDADVVKFRFYIDGKTIIAPLNEGGSVFIEGKSITIEQISSGVNYLATWEVIERPDRTTDFEKINWLSYPSDSSQSLVAAFSEERLFVLSINRTSIGCRNGIMFPSIDGKPVEDINGNIIEFLEGSSIIGYGKIVSVNILGNCDHHEPFRGSMKIYNRP